MTTTPKVSATPSQGPISSWRLEHNPTSSTSPPLNIAGAEVWVLTTNTYWKNVGYTPADGFLWIQIYPQTSTGSSSLTWSTISSDTLTMSPNCGYYLTSTNPISVTFASTGFSLGSVVQIFSAVGAGAVTINLSGSQTISYGSIVATSFLTMLAGGSSATFVCLVPNTTWGISTFSTQLDKNT